MTLGTVTAPALLTLTATDSDTPTLPAASNAIAVSIWLPSPTSAVFQIASKGAATTGAPICESASKNHTLVMPTLSTADARTVTLPATVTPTGAVMLTSGGTVSGPDVTRPMPIAVWPAPSVISYPKVSVPRNGIGGAYVSGSVPVT